MKLILQRHPSGLVNTKGRLTVYADNGKPRAEFDTLELAWRDNKPFVSCIPAGNYMIQPYTSKKFKKCLIVNDVESRTGILFHAANYANSDEEQKRIDVSGYIPKFSELQGCIAPGTGYSDINMPGIDYILNSRMSMNGLLTLLGDNKHQLEVKNAG